MELMQMSPFCMDPRRHFCLHGAKFFTSVREALHSATEGTILFSKNRQKHPKAA